MAMRCTAPKPPRSTCPFGDTALVSAGSVHLRVQCRCHQTRSGVCCFGVSVRPFSNHLLSTHLVPGTGLGPETVTVDTATSLLTGPRTGSSAPTHQLLQHSVNSPSISRARSGSLPALAQGPERGQWAAVWAHVCAPSLGRAPILWVLTVSFGDASLT